MLSDSTTWLIFTALGSGYGSGVGSGSGAGRLQGTASEGTAMGAEFEAERATNTHTHNEEAEEDEDVHMLSESHLGVLAGIREHIQKHIRICSHSEKSNREALSMDEMPSSTNKRTKISVRLRPRRLTWLATGHNTGDCFVAAILTPGTFPRTPSKLSITNLRAEAGIQANGYTNSAEMVQLLRHLSYGCVIVQPTRRAATILNPTPSSTKCIVVAMLGIRHVEPVLLDGTVELRSLSDIVERLSSYGIEVPLTTVQGGTDLAAGIVISDDEGADGALNTRVTIDEAGAGSGSSSGSGSGSD